MVNKQAAVNLFTIIYIFLQYPMIKDIITCFTCNSNWLSVDQLPTSTPIENINVKKVQSGENPIISENICVDYVLTGLSVCQLGKFSSVISLITIFSIILTLLIVGNKDADNDESLRDMYFVFTIVHICLTILIISITIWKNSSLAKNSIHNYVIQFCIGFLFLTMYFSV